MLKRIIFLSLIGLALMCVADAMSPNITEAQSLFKTKVDYGAGDGPRSVFAVDLDGDSDNDLAVANLSSNNVSVLLNNGDGTFQMATSYGAGNAPNSVFAIEIDGDGDNDLAVANYFGSYVSILLNNGDGTFPTTDNYGAADDPISVFGVDLDGDGDNDLAVANRNSNNVSVLFNNEDGTFQTAVDYEVGAHPQAVFGIDLDVLVLDAVARVEPSERLSAYPPVWVHPVEHLCSPQQRVRRPPSQRVLREEEAALFLVQVARPGLSLSRPSAVL